MLSRRDLIAAGVIGGLAAAPGEAGVIEQEADREGQREIARQIRQVEDALRDALLSNSLDQGFVAKLREQMQQFFRSNTKFPDFIDVGMNVFLDIYDWHVRNRQQLVIQRGPDGRYWIQFMFTNLILRAEVDASHIGIAYDKA